MKEANKLRGWIQHKFQAPRNKLPVQTYNRVAATTQNAQELEAKD